MRKAGVTFKAGNGAEIFVDRANIVIGHVVERRPWHDLQIRSKLRVRLVRINAGPQDVKELLVGRPPLPEDPSCRVSSFGE
jgi:hypothetical protein